MSKSNLDKFRNAVMAASVQCYLSTVMHNGKDNVDIDEVISKCIEPFDDNDEFSELSQDERLTPDEISTVKQESKTETFKANVMAAANILDNIIHYRDKVDKWTSNQHGIRDATNELRDIIINNKIDMRNYEGILNMVTAYIERCSSMSDEIMDCTYDLITDMRNNQALDVIDLISTGDDFMMKLNQIIMLYNDCRLEFDNMINLAANVRKLIN